MKYLTLIRHAKSSWGNASLRDFDRPLNERGLSDAPRIGAYLQESDFPAVDRIISSPALRAKTTAGIIARALGADSESIILEAGIYEASLPHLLNLIRGFEDPAKHIILVGHNPGFEQLARALDPAFAGDGEKFPTCGLAHIDLAVEYWVEVAQGCAVRTHFICPKML